MGVHPAEGQSDPSGTHNISFYCDNIEKTVKKLKERGVKFKSAIKDRGYGLVTSFVMPGGVKVDLYQPKYARHGK